MPHTVSWIGCPPTVQSCQMQLSPTGQPWSFWQSCTETSVAASAAATLEQRVDEQRASKTDRAR